MVHVLCAALLLLGTLFSLMAHRLIVERERQTGAAWAHAQARALGHGGLMWALARLEDPRALDDNCRAAPPGPGRLRFSDQAERTGSLVSCAVDNGAGEDVDSARWSCRCGAPADGSTATGWTSGSTSMAEPSGTPAPGRLEWTFEPSGELLLLVVRAHWRSNAAEGAWREQVLLRRDGQSTWRMVVGSWWDDR